MSNENELPHLQITMERDNVADIPRFDLPLGYSIRPYQPGDEATWLHLHRIGDLLNAGDFYDQVFADQFGSDIDQLRSRMFYVDSPAGETVGSISAWFTHAQPRRGRIHWVIVHPDHRRRGLTKSMMSHAMQRIATQHQSIVLDTSLARPWAVKVYLDFGFHPTPLELADPTIRQGWATLQQFLQHPLLGDWLKT